MHQRADWGQPRGMDGERDRCIPRGSGEARQQNPEKRLGEGDLEPKLGAGWEEGVKPPGGGMGRGRPRGLAGGTQTLDPGA